MFLFLFGGQRRRGLARKVFWLGVVWTEVVWLLPLLDWVLGLAPVAVNIEHGRSVGPFHLIGGNLIFSWIVVAYPLALFHSRWRLSDLPLWARESRYMLWALCYTGGIVACLIAAMAFGSKEFYRIGNVLLETFMIAWFFLLTRKPQVISLMRREVHDNHERKVLLDEAEAATIGLRLDRLSADGIFRRPDLDLGRLAGRIQVPAYRLSRYFNEKLATSFPVWLNRSRVNWVCARMAEVPGTSLLDLALEAGYSSKTTFNTQFSRLTGMSPSEYRKRLNDGGVSDMLPEKKNLGQGVRI